jgi:6-phosphofructokinase 1
VSLQGEGGVGYKNRRLGGVAFQLSAQLKEIGFKADIRETVLGHTQRGGSPIAFDRILATLFGVKAAEMVINGEYGRIVVSQDNEITSIPLEESIRAYNVVKTDSFIVHAARRMGISFGDE